jgi:hypothetical protein
MWALNGRISAISMKDVLVLIKKGFGEGLLKNENDGVKLRHVHLSPM